MLNCFLVYELSAQLALESCDFAQLNTLLPHLIFDLYPSIPIEHQLTYSASLSQRQPQARDLTAQDIQDRRLMFASVLLLIPICTRLCFSDFLTNFIKINDQLLSSSTASELPHFSIVNPSAGSSRLRTLLYIFNSIRRGNWVQFKRTVTPLLAKLSLFSSTPPPDRSDFIDWDAVVLLHVFKPFRDQSIWNCLKKSYNSLSDDDYLARCLCLEQTTHLDKWLQDAGIARSPDGTVPLRLSK